MLRRHGLHVSPGQTTGRARLHRGRDGARRGSARALRRAGRTGRYAPLRHAAALDIALVLAQDPELIILDEPAAGLSAAETRDLITLLKGIIGQRSLILIDHDMDVVYALSDRITVLDYGRVLVEGTPAEVSADPDVQRIYLGEEAG
ncbi:MAG: hypothetical protein WDN69_17080 [Aliidongia sp.]